MRPFLIDFFVKYGFRLFGRAYSRYGNTYNAIPNILNFSSESVDGALVSAREPYTLSKNNYFEHMYNIGYNINVYGGDYIDLCNSSRDYIASCRNSSFVGINPIEALDITLAEKAVLIYRLYARLSAIQSALGIRYNHLRERLRSSGWTLPEWWLKDARLGPVPSMPLFDRVTADVAEAAPGDMFFVYLLMPHFPYVYDSMCNIYPPADWEVPVSPEPMPLNDGQSRARRYGRYLEQMSCLDRKLDAMFQTWQKVGIYDRLTIVIHGDHGPKISEHRAHAENKEELSRADYVDTFSTLFAVKKPDFPIGYDRRIAAVQDLLGEVVGWQAGDDPDTNEIPYVFLKGNLGKPMQRRPFPAFGDSGWKNRRLEEVLAELKRRS